MCAKLKMEIQIGSMTNILNIKKYSPLNTKNDWENSSNSPKKNIQNKITAFSREELNSILIIYGRKVVSGEWKDYTIDTLNDQAIFSVYKKTNELPQFSICKIPKLKNSQGMYQVKSTDGRILKRGSELPLVLKILEKDKNKYRII